MLYGFDIDGTKIELAVFNEKLEKQYSERVATPKEDYQAWLNAIVSLEQKADEQFQCKGNMGLGIPSFINNETGLAEITNIHAAHGKSILSDLVQLLGREIRAENDASGLSNFDYLYEALPQTLPQYLLKSAKVPLIKKAKYGDSGGSRGAAALWL